MSDLAGAVARAYDVGGAGARTGSVAALTAGGITVNLGGGLLVDVPYLSSYQPVLGDAVLLLLQGQLLVAAGVYAALPPNNAVANASFEDDAPLATTISHWTKVVTAGSAVVRVAAVTGPFCDGGQALEVSDPTSGGSNTSLLSAPVSVAPGERWAAAAGWLAYADGATTPLVAPVVSLSLAWYVTADAAPGATVATDTLVASARGPFGAMPAWATLRDRAGPGSLVPGGARAMRVKLTAVHASSGGAWFDRVIARKVG